MFRKFIQFSSALVLVIVLCTLFTLPAYAQGSASIRIPSIGVDAPIVSIGIRTFPNGAVTWDTTRLTSEVGFLEGTAWFGQGGNVVLGGHSELAQRVPTVFYRLGDVVVGDEIVVTVNGGERRYTVTRITVVADSDLSILQPTSSERLTIMTCDPASYVSGIYTRRIVIIAVPA